MAAQWAEKRMNVTRFDWPGVSRGEAGACWSLRKRGSAALINEMRIAHWAESKKNIT
jgi:hypothetical protein